MRRLPLLLATLFLAAPVPAQEEEGGGGTIRDKKSGLVVRMPDKWSRETAREKGGVKFAGMYDLTPSKYVLFVVETGPATGFDEAVWLGNEKTAAAKNLKSMDTPWTTEPVMIGGARAVRYTVGGKANAEKGFDLRIRGCGLVRNDVFFKISELSYNRAHDEAADALKAMWEAVEFEEANPFAEEEKEEGGGEEETPAEEGEAAGGGEAPKGEPLVIEDKVGKFKVTLPPGWSIAQAPDGNEENAIRVVAKRPGDDGTEVATFEIHRYRARNAELFASEEPGDVLLKVINEEVKLFEDAYGKESAASMRPEIDARSGLGGAEKACGYEVRGISLAEEAKVEDAKKLVARGDTSVTVPQFLPIVFRGRLAMISPYIFVTRAFFRRDLSDNEKLIEEHRQMVDSLEFTSMEAKPPPLDTGEKAKEEGKVNVTPLGDTRADPANKTDRKVTKLNEYKQGDKVVAALKLEYVLPPGFQEVVAPKGVMDPEQKALYLGENLPLQVVAQDENNGWVWIRVTTRNLKSLAPAQGRQAGEKFEDKKTTFESWISNFESAALGAGKLPKKPVDVRVGNLTGDGCELEGKISKFRATQVNMVTIEGGWWIKFEMKTRGTGDKTFAGGIKTFLKKFKAAKK